MGGFNGFYVGAQFGSSVQTAKHKKEAKKVKLNEDVTYMPKAAYFDKAAYEAAVKQVMDAAVTNPDETVFANDLFQSTGNVAQLLKVGVGADDLPAFNAGLAKLC